MLSIRIRRDVKSSGEYLDAENLSSDQCHNEFFVTVKPTTIVPALQTLVFKKFPDKKDNRVFTKHVEIYVSKLQRLEILTTTHQVLVGQVVKLNVIGWDVANNTFSWLKDLPFQWNVSRGSEEFLETLEDSTTVTASEDEECITPAAMETAVARGSSARGTLVKGLATGSALALVDLDDLQASLKIIVKRIIKICPGSLLNVLEGTKTSFKFCISNEGYTSSLGCFLSGKEFLQKMSKITRDSYDWMGNAPQTDGIWTFTKAMASSGETKIIVKDFNNNENFGETIVRIGALNSVEHFFSSQYPDVLGSLPNDGVLADCPYSSSSNSEWPPLPTTLGRAFTTTPRHYLVKGRSCLFFCMARAEFSNNLTGMVAPHTHESFSFNIKPNGAAEAILTDQRHPSVAYARVGLAKSVGNATVECSFRGKSTSFQVTVLDRILVQPLVLSTPMCHTTLFIQNGSGKFRSGRVSDSSVLVLEKPISADQVSFSTRADSLSKSAFFDVWDAIDASNDERVTVQVHKVLDISLRQANGEILEMVVGESIVLHADGVDEQRRIFDCCHLDPEEERVVWWVENTRVLESIETEKSKSMACSDLTIKAVSFGDSVVHVRLAGSSTEEDAMDQGEDTPAYATILIHVTSPVHLNPPCGSVMPTNTKAQVHIVGGRSDATFALTHSKQTQNIPLRDFEITCGPAEQQEHFSLTWKSPEIDEQKFNCAFDCVVAKSCRVRTRYEEQRSNLPPAEYFESGSIPEFFLYASSADGAKNITIRQAWETTAVWGVVSQSGAADATKTRMIQSGSALKLEKSTSAAEQPFESIDIVGSVPSLNFTQCELRKARIVSRMMVEPTNTWFWSICPAEFGISHGSGSFAVTRRDATTDVELNSVKRRVLVRAAPNSGAFEVGVRDVSAFPFSTEANLTGEFRDIVGLTVSHPFVLVRGSPESRIIITPDAAFALDPQRLFAWKHHRLSLIVSPPSAAHVRALGDGEFSLATMVDGDFFVRAELCSSCDPTHCVSSEETRLVSQSKRSLVLFPGSSFELSQEDGATLEGCFTSDTDVANVDSNGRIVAACTEGFCKLQCFVPVKRENRSYEIFVQRPSYVELKGPGEVWTLPPTSSFGSPCGTDYDNTRGVQVHGNFAYDSKHVPLDAFVVPVNREDEWTFEVQGGSSIGKLSFKQPNSTLMLYPTMAGDILIKTSVRLGDANATCAAEESDVALVHALTDPYKYRLLERPSLISPSDSRLVLPPTSKFDLVFGSKCASCVCRASKDCPLGFVAVSMDCKIQVGNDEQGQGVDPGCSVIVYDSVLNVVFYTIPLSVERPVSVSLVVETNGKPTATTSKPFASTPVFISDGSSPLKARILLHDTFARVFSSGFQSAKTYVRFSTNSPQISIHSSTDNRKLQGINFTESGSNTILTIRTLGLGVQGSVTAELIQDEQVKNQATITIRVERSDPLKYVVGLLVGTLSVFLVPGSDGFSPRVVGLQIIIFSALFLGCVSFLDV